MLDRQGQLEAAQAELRRSYGLSPYEAVDVAWVAVIKLANLFPGPSEHARLLALVESLPLDRIRVILSHEAVDTLLNIDPPLESVVSTPHERLDLKRTIHQVAVVRNRRDTEPTVALVNLAEILKRIRNRRAHGFKTPDGPRDQEILSAAASLLQAVGQAVSGVIGA